MVAFKDILGGPPKPPGGALPQPGALLTLRELRNPGSGRLREEVVRSRCQAVPLDPHTILCRVLGRFKFLVDSRDLGLAPHLMLDGFWERWCTEFMLERIRPGQVAWDVGANLGYYAVLMAELVGPAGRVLALEPNPRLALLCERNLALNGFWHTTGTQRVAASDGAAATLRFRASFSDPKNGRLLPRDTTPEDAAPDHAAPDDPAPEDDTLEIAVRAASLDTLATGPVDFLKIDVEGAEEQVWAGMQGLLDRSPAITVLMEFNARRCAAPERMLDEIAARFPLRELTLEGPVAPVAAAQILPRAEDTLLVLTNEPL